MTVVAIQRIRSGVLTSADTTTLSIVNSAGVVVLAPTVIAPTSAGSYSYETSSLPAGSYTATWIFTAASLPLDTISRAFTVDAAQEISEGITLMALERLVARRVGPYRRIKAASPGSTLNTIYSLRLKSSVKLGGYTDQYVLRRGLTWGDELINGFVADDRIRLVSDYTPVTGLLLVDRDYAVGTANNEAVELLALDPDDELRPAVIDGLKRCFFWDTVSITVTGSGVYNIDLTAATPWLKDVNQVRNVSLSYPSQLLPPRRLGWWEAYRDGKSLKLYTKGGAVGSVTLQVLRPVHTLINGELSLAGPNDDLDVLYVDPEYAAWAGVLECWKTVPEVLEPLAVANMRPSRADAAAAFTVKSMSLVQQYPERLQLDYGVPDLVQIGNLAEPIS
jgi:hypothetical protein